MKVLRALSNNLLQQGVYMALPKLVWVILILALFTLACSITSPSKVETLDIDVPSVTITGDFLLNDSSFPGIIYQSGMIYLRDSDSTSYTELRSTAYGSYSLAVVPGTYDTIYTHQFGLEVPLNENAVVAAGVAINADQALDINVAAVSVRPRFTLDGKAFPASIYNSAKFYLQSSSGGELIALGNSYQVNDPVLVMPGTYDVIYSHENGGLVPQNQNAIVKSGVTIDAAQALAIDVSSVFLRSRYTLNGDPFPGNIYNSGAFYLRNAASGDLVVLGNSYDQASSSLVIPGDYDVIYTHKFGTKVPVNKDTVIASGVSIGSGRASLTDVPAVSVTGESRLSGEPVITSGVSISSGRALLIDVPAVSVTGEFSLNGESFPASIDESAEFYLRDSSSDEPVLLGKTNGAATPVLVVEGTYDIVYGYFNGSDVPQNQRATIQRDVEVDTDGQILKIDVSAVDITGQFSLNGGTFSSSINESADFFLRSTDSEETIPLGSSYRQANPVTIVAGTYDVLYTHRNGSDVPQNENKEIVNAVLLDSTQGLEIDVSTVSVKGVFTLNGEPFPASIYESAEFYLGDPATGEELFLGSSYEETEAVSIITGSYDVIYRIKNGDQLPQNTVSNLFSTFLE